MKMKTFTVDDFRRILLEKIGLDLGADDVERADRMTLDEMGLDSLAALEIQNVIKDDYGITIPEELMDVTGSEIVGLVQEQMNAEVA